MKVLLINPPVPDQKNWVREGRCQQWDIWGVPFPPLSLALIAGQIKNIAKTLILDSGPANLNLEKTLEKIKKFNPDLLIISTATPTIETDLGWFLPKVKESNPNIKSAVIGIHVTELPKETLEEFPDLDFVIRREPELTAKELVEFLKENRSDFENILGLAFKKNNRIIVNPLREFLEDLDQLEFPFWPGIDFKNYRLPILNKPFNLISFARGCPFDCKFCNASTYYGKKIRKRSPEKIVEEIENNIKNYGLRDFLFWTEFVTLDKEYLRSVLNLIKEKGLDKKIRWVSNSRSDIKDLSLFKELKEAGCWQMAFGLEFGSDQILKLSNKGATIEAGRKTIEAAAQASIVCDGHFILGYPGETKETLQKTIDFALSLPLTFAHFYAATPFPGSQLFREAIENKWIENLKWKEINQDIPIIKTQELSPEITKEYIKKAYRKFYLRPKTIYKIVKIAKTPLEFFSIFKIGTRFVLDILKK
jgi:radical SAM superfamily enzyme YgiQ (UPF0313 family)